MDKFPIMAMHEGDAVTVTDEWNIHQGTVIWWNSYEGFSVRVRLQNGTEQTFEASGPRAAKFWR